MFDLQSLNLHELEKLAIARELGMRFFPTVYPDSYKGDYTSYSDDLMEEVDIFIRQAKREVEAAREAQAQVQEARRLRKWAALPCRTTWQSEDTAQEAEADAQEALKQAREWARKWAPEWFY